MRERWSPDTGQGWHLDVQRFHDPARFDRTLRPLFFVPGYGMNSFILGFHPEGESMIGHLTGAGFEVWTANLRGQGDSRRRQGPRRYGFRELALVDLPTALATVLAETRTSARQVDAIGCSLGATLLYAHLAHARPEHNLASMVSLGGPLRLLGVHPLLRVLFASPAMVGQLEIRGLRYMARAALPLAQRFPALVSMYMNTEQIDLSAAGELVKTVDDPSAHLNRQIGHWMRQKDLVVAGRNVTESLRGLELPLLAVLGNADGIAPREAVLSVVDVLGRDRVDVLEVGDAEVRFAHADLFIGRQARARVFEPLSRWLLAQNGRGEVTDLRAS